MASMKLIMLAMLVAGTALFTAGCDQKPASTGAETTGTTGTETTGSTTATTTGETGTSTVPETPKDNPVSEDTQKGPVVFEETGSGEIAKRKPKDGEEVAVMTTNRGRIVLMFFSDKAPNHVKRFKEASEKGIFDGTKFHRVIPNFMIQGGDPNSKDDDRRNDGIGGWGTPLKAEFNDVHHAPGILSAARTQDPNSATTQFFICQGPNAASLDGQYSAYGKVIEGMKVVETIVNLPRDPRNNPNPENPALIYHVKIEKWPIK